MMSEGNKAKVLVADNEQISANTLTIILNQAGFEARAVYSGEKVVEVAQSFRPQLLISDVVMTGINGIEAAIQVLEKLPSCKVLHFSGQAATVDLLAKAHSQNQDLRFSLNRFTRSISWRSYAALRWLLAPKVFGAMP